MDEEQNAADGNKGKVEDVMLPGFRFHPTDEELVGFYLRRKTQNRPLPIQLIKQLDIYKYEPWDLPKLAATTGEKEWYFYCPRDRKYRNSARPNRVTAAGFWKATGTDRPIYSSHGSPCIGLKKSLVFYRGRAARGIKTDWMMHEFRLPASTTPTNKTLSATATATAKPNEAWAICRIFKKTNSMAHRPLCLSWPFPSPHTSASDIPLSSNISCTTETGSMLQFCSNTDPQQATTPAFDIPNNYDDNSFGPTFHTQPADSFMFDAPSMLFKPSEFQVQPPQLSGFSVHLPPEMQFNNAHSETSASPDYNQLVIMRSIGFPLGLPDAGKPNLPWDSSPCPTETSITYFPSKCYS